MFLGGRFLPNWVCRIGGIFILGRPLGANSRTTVAAFHSCEREVSVIKLLTEKSNKDYFQVIIILFREVLESFYTAIFKKITRKLITHVKIVFEVSRIFRSFSSRVAHSSPHHGLSIVVSLDLFLRGGFIWTLDFLNNVILPFGFVNVIQYSEMMTQSRIIHTPLRTLIHTHTNLGGG